MIVGPGGPAGQRTRGRHLGRNTLLQIPRVVLGWAIFHKRKFGRSSVVCNGLEGARSLTWLGSSRRAAKILRFSLGSHLIGLLWKSSYRGGGTKNTHRSQAHPRHPEENCCDRRARARDRARRLSGPVCSVFPPLPGCASPPAPPPPSSPRTERALRGAQPGAGARASELAATSRLGRRVALFPNRAAGI